MSRSLARDSGRPLVAIVDPVDPHSGALDSVRRMLESALLPRPEGAADTPFRMRTLGHSDDLAPLIDDFSERMAAVCLSASLGQNRLITAIRSLRASRPATPVFILQSDAAGEIPFNEADLKRLAVQGTLPKDASYEDLARELASLAPVIEAFDGLSQASRRERLEEKPAVVSREDHHFFPILADEFVSGIPVYLDVFVRLASGHYVKVLKRGDSFSAGQLLKFLQKGVDRFHARKTERERYLDYCDRLAAASLVQPASPDVRIERTLRHGEAAMSFLRESGFGEEQLRHAHAYVDRVEQVVRSMKLESNELYERFQKTVDHYDHGVSCTMVAAFLCQQMQVDRAVATEVVGLAALLHDIGLYYMPAACQSENEAEMTPRELELYRTHPQVGADILRAVQGIEQSVIQIVEQHHERRNLMGFPRHQGVRRTNPLAEIVGISDELVRLIQLSKTDPSIQPLQVMQTRVFPGFSPVVTRAFHDLFYSTIL